MLFKSKKGNAPDASAAAALIAIIAALIVLYILFIPPEERAKILEEETGVVTTESGAVEDRNILLSKSPRSLIPSETKKFEKELPSVNIQVGEEGVEIKKVNSLFIKRSLFTSKDYGVNFNIESLKDVKSALLNFLVQEGTGRLIIGLNGHEIFNREVESGNIAPIEMKEYLVQGINALEFKVSSPGAVFWRVNAYDLENVLITSDVLQKEAQESVLTFVVSAEEKDNLERANLRFLSECDELASGVLNIELNGYSLYSGVPDCGILNKAIEFLPDKLLIGENRLRFRTEKGWFLLDDIRISSELREVRPKTFYFEVDEKYFSGTKKELDRPYKYYCDNDKESIYLEYKGSYERTGWSCNDDETCENNFRRYQEEQSSSTVENALCEEKEYNDDTYKYYCGQDGETIYFTFSGGTEQRTGWNCDSGEACEGNFRRYNGEEDKATVKSALCKDRGYGDYELDSDVDVVLYMKFEDDYSEKRAKLRVNGHLIELDQTNREFERSIRKFVEDGTNVINIDPDEVLNIVELKVELES